jgi:hypothetical protein
LPGLGIALRCGRHRPVICLGTTGSVELSLGIEPCSAHPRAFGRAPKGSVPEYASGFFRPFLESRDRIGSSALASRGGPVVEGPQASVHGCLDAEVRLRFSARQGFRGRMFRAVLVRLS